MQKMSIEAKKARNAYAKRWREKNKDKNRAIQVRYWEHRAEREKQEQKKEGK